MIPRPKDIPPLRVTDKDAWFSELGELESMHVEDRTTPIDGGDWITIFEKRTLAQEEQYNVPYRQEISLESFLIPSGVYNEANVLDEIAFVSERFAITDFESAITLAQARETLLRTRTDNLDVDRHESIPLIAEHENPFTFLGYRNICSLASFILRDLELSFEVFDLLKNGQRVAAYEVWQEGYQDESYTREKLSFGVRLRVRCELLAEICNRYNRIVCTHIHEKRGYFKSIHDQKPDDWRDSRRYILFR